VAVRRTQAERRLASRSALVAAAAELVVERGIQRASLADIARRAGFSQALVTHLFGSKVGLVEALNEASDHFYRDHAAHRLADRRGLAALLAAADLYLDLADGADPLGRVQLVLWGEALATTPEIRGARVAFDEAFRCEIGRLIQQGIDDGQVRPTPDPTVASFAVVGILRELAIQLILGTGTVDLGSAKAAADANLRSLLQAP
jgi:AcrR family transcriptional regulator